jgi:feruloyl esterase
MRIIVLGAVIALLSVGTTHAQVTDWGGGFSTGVDSATTTSFAATSNAQSPSKAKCNALAGFAVAYAKETSARSRFAQIIDAPTSVLSAEIIPAERDLPEVCRVSGIVAPDIQFELQLPTTAWNGKFMHYGCGGMCGVVYRVQAEEPLARGYAVITSDMGHTGSPNNTAFRYNDITAMIDFSYRATHVVTLAAKEIIDEFYGNGPQRSYFMGCSTGGVQGVIEAQRYPHDFDGIIAGAPAYGTGPSYLEWSARANLDAQGNAIMDDKKLPLVRKAVIAACDKLDGTEDGLLQNPATCKWDPSEIECKGKASASCLTKAEADVVRKIYKGPANSKGESVSLGYAGMARGSEYMWSPSFIAPKGEKATRLVDYNDWFGDGVFPTVAANAKRPYDYDSDPQRGNTGWGGPVFQWLRYAMNPDLRRFKNAGGKMILYHGWDDNETAPGASVDYYETTSRTMGGDAATQEFFRLFMIPGMAHCRRGPGGDAFDVITSLEKWVEKGEAPDQLLVHRLKKEQTYLGLPRLRYPLAADSYDKTRPVFPYPAIAKWSGQGDHAKAETWEKVAP